MKKDSNQENTIDFEETVLSSVTMDSQPNQTTSAPPDSSNYQNNHDNVRLIRVSKPIQTVKYCSNSISTSKYNFLTFLPIFLFEQFQKYSNVFFLIIVILQQIPGVSPTGRYTTLVPLVFILGVSAIKEVVEDYKRRKSDKMLNNKKTRVFRPSNYIESSWSSVKWKDICVGDIVKITAGELFPADLLLLSSSEPNSICYIQTSNLDGETNLKIRQGLSKTSLLIDSDHLKSFNAEIECELPNQHLYEFSGNLKFLDETL